MRLDDAHMPMEDSSLKIEVVFYCATAIDKVLKTCDPLCAFDVRWQQPSMQNQIILIIKT
ncbi:hypothetical protein ALP26_02871 [Pseudomonas savastanoi pv. glycinea]|uniref:Uncharacterized protein n=2 Tax=Pseudomonas savastanoi pv. glycinea TaxID=318 RepID=A0A3M2ZPN8_PSESG|nr:hypothetical protein ALQ97_04156 [Pseudomonas savastanoi pv. glycinea]RML90090.1 hypothetical protein ALQ87_02381 [Pseudomonas savastanoi pv. glycinea]RMN02560.1 hypothetical protein ALQ67_00126 [Pseudomonas savastanoi pv. glycinea]RMN35434.1 hypothetical protein ALQ66_00481 [Pseudomonas savastanoi pv. glycinea]RMO45539.1 hypothetical protein ALQ41_01375 [Pseudomonas savastanoi pv. glycinea]